MYTCLISLSFCLPAEPPPDVTVFIHLRLETIALCLTHIKMFEDDLDTLRASAKKWPARAKHYEALIEKTVIRKEKWEALLRKSINGLKDDIRVQIKVYLWKFGFPIRS